MKEPRPNVTSARPFDAAFSVEKRSNTRMGSSDDSTVTAEPSLIRLVRPAVAASTTSGADTEKSGRWCSPTPKASTPTLVGQHALVDHIADHLRVRPGFAIGADGDVAEGIQSKFEILWHRVSGQLKSTASASGRGSARLQ